MKGAVFIEEVTDFNITNSSFMYNDPGFIWNVIQVVGLIDDNEYSEKVIRASSIFISDGLQNA